MTDSPQTDLTARKPTEHTSKAYAADWRHFSRWCRLTGRSMLPPSPECVAEYLSTLTDPARIGGTLSRSTIERRLAGVIWNYAQRGQPLDRAHPALSSAISQLRLSDARAPVRKSEISHEDIQAMVATLPFDLRGLRDRALLLIGHAAGLGRSALIGLDLSETLSEGSSGQIRIHEDGISVRYNTRTGEKRTEIKRLGDAQMCPVKALEQWLYFAKIQSGPIFVRTSRDGKRALEARLNDRHVARLIKQTVLAAGLRSDLPEKERLALFSGQSLCGDGGIYQNK